MLTPHLEIALASLQARAPHITADAFSAAIADAVVHPVDVGGQPVGAVIVKGAEIHACIDPAAHGLWMSRKLLRVLQAVVDQFGAATTHATTESGRQFVVRLGFVPAGGAWALGADHGL